MKNKTHLKLGVALFIAFLSFSPTAQAQFPMTDSLGLPSTITQGITNAKTAVQDFFKLGAIKEQIGAIGTGIKNVTEFAQNTKEQIEAGIEQVKVYKEQAEAYVEEAKAYKAELDRNIQLAKDTYNMAKETVEGLPGQLEGLQSMAEGKLGELKGQAEGLRDSVGGKLGLPQSSADAAGTDAGNGTPPQTVSTAPMSADAQNPAPTGVSGQIPTAAKPAVTRQAFSTGNEAPQLTAEGATVVPMSVAGTTKLESFSPAASRVSAVKAAADRAAMIQAKQGGDTISVAPATPIAKVSGQALPRKTNLRTAFTPATASPAALSGATPMLVEGGLTPMGAKVAPVEGLLPITKSPEGGTANPADEEGSEGEAAEEMLTSDKLSKIKDKAKAAALAKAAAKGLATETATEPKEVKALTKATDERSQIKGALSKEPAQLQGASGLTKAVVKPAQSATPAKARTAAPAQSQSAPRKTNLRRSFTTSSIEGFGRTTSNTKVALALLAEVPDDCSDVNGTRLFSKATCMYCELSSKKVKEKGAVDKCLMSILNDINDMEAGRNKDASLAYQRGKLQAAAQMIAESYRAANKAETFYDDKIAPILEVSENNEQDALANLVEFNRAVSEQINDLVQIYATRLTLKMYSNYQKYNFKEEEKDEKDAK